MNKRYEELKKYIIESKGITRTKLNLLAFIGLFYFWWLILYIFYLLGKQIAGFIYFAILIVTAANLMRTNFTNIDGVY